MAGSTLSIRSSRAGSSDSDDDGGASRSLSRPALVLLATLATVGLVALLTALAVHTFPADSDGATVVLEGQAMAQGHLLLGGWAISLDSFWTIDALWYAVAVLVAGVHGGLLYVVPAAIAAAVVVVGIVLGRRALRGAPALVAALTVVVLLALPSHALAIFFLRGPLHVGTALWCLLAFWCLASNKFDWRFALAVVFLAAGLLGDLQMLALGVVPAALAGVVAMGRTRTLRSGAPGLTAAVASLVVAECIRQLARAIGSFSIAKANPTAGGPQLTANVKHAAHEFVTMMGVGRGAYGLGGVPVWLSAVHVLAIAALVVAGVWAAVRLVAGLMSGTSPAAADAPWRLDDLLLLATLASPAAFVILAASNDPEYARYLTAGIIFGSILTARQAGRLTAAALDRSGARPLAAIAVTTAGALLAVAAAAGVALQLAQPIPPSPTEQLGAFLQAHHLDRGIGAYWSSSIVTVETGGAVTIRPVVSPNDETLVRYDRNSSASWYTTHFHFLVFDLHAPWGNVTWQTAVATFGRPAHAYTVAGTFRVMTWRHPLVVPRRR